MAALQNPQYYVVPKKYKKTLLMMGLENKGLVKSDVKTFQECDVEDVFKRKILMNTVSRIEKIKQKQRMMNNGR